MCAVYLCCLCSYAVLLLLLPPAVLPALFCYLPRGSLCSVPAPCCALLYVPPVLQCRSVLCPVPVCVRVCASLSSTSYLLNLPLTPTSPPLSCIIIYYDRYLSSLKLCCVQECVTCLLTLAYCLLNDESPELLQKVKPTAQKVIEMNQAFALKVSRHFWLSHWKGCSDSVMLPASGDIAQRCRVHYLVSRIEAEVGFSE